MQNNIISLKMPWNESSSRVMISLNETTCYLIYAGIYRINMSKKSTAMIKSKGVQKSKRSHLKSQFITRKTGLTF